jgi:hypothetical protein
MVLKLLAILPSGSAGKIFEKNLEFGKMGGYYDTPLMCPLSIKQNTFFKKPFRLGVFWRF